MSMPRLPLPFSCSQLWPYPLHPSPPLCSRGLCLQGMLQPRRPSKHSCISGLMSMRQYLMADPQQTLPATPTWVAQTFLSSCLTLRLSSAGSPLQLIFTAMMSTCNEVHMLDRPSLI